jgi:hypothetical protein
MEAAMRNLVYPLFLSLLLTFAAYGQDAPKATTPTATPPTAAATPPAGAVAPKIETFSPLENARDDARDSTCLLNLNKIYVAIMNADMDGKQTPASLADLLPKFLEDPKTLLCASDAHPLALKDNLKTSYYYIGAMPTRKLQDAIIAYDHAQHSDGTFNILRMDGHAEALTEDELRKELTWQYNAMQKRLAEEQFDRAKFKAFCMPAANALTPAPRRRERAPEKVCCDHLQKIANAMQLYVRDTRDKTPPTLADLVLDDAQKAENKKLEIEEGIFLEEMLDPKYLVCPLDKEPLPLKRDLKTSYVYLGPVHYFEIPHDTIVAYDHVPHADGSYGVLTLIGANHMSAAELKLELSKQYAKLKDKLKAPQFDEAKVKAFFMQN